MQAYFLFFLKVSGSYWPERTFGMLFIAVGVCEVMKVLFEFGRGMKR